MELSLAQSIEGNVNVVDTPFPLIKSDPAMDQVNPGLAQIVNLFDTIVPMQGHSVHTIEKKVEEPFAPVNSDIINSQKGSGNRIDPDILNSFQHPIVTDSIIFPKSDAGSKSDGVKKVSARKAKSDVVEPATKKIKVEHKFHVV